MEFTDNRGKRIVYVGNCLLNQNARAPGVAVRQGVFPELIRILFDNGLSIEQLPCLECIGVGGVSRKTVYKTFRPLLATAAGHGRYALLRPVVNAWWRILFARRCKKAAVKIVDRMQDYIEQGYQIVGIVSANDSPTCGVTKSMDVAEYVRRTVVLKRLELPLAKQILLETLIDGVGVFTDSILRELERRKLNVRIVGLDPWAESPEAEAIQVAGLLGLRT